MKRILMATVIALAGTTASFAETGSNGLSQALRLDVSRLAPTADLINDRDKREFRQVETQRFQHTRHDRLPSGTVYRLAGATRLARRRGIPQRAFRFVVRPTHRVRRPVGLLHRPGRHEREQLLRYHQPHDLVDQ